MSLNDEKLKRLIKWFNGGQAPPFKIVMSPTNRCNLRCMFCPNALPRSEAKFKVEDEMSDDLWQTLVKDGLKLSVREWSIIGGGEPLLRHDTVFSMIDLIKSFHGKTDCELITNGTLLTKNDIEKLVEIKMDRILFSIDAPDAETHDYLRGVNNTFEKSSNNLKAISDTKKKMGSDKPYLKVNMVLNNKNYKSITKMIEFIKNAGAQELALHPMRDYYELKSQIQHLKMSNVQKKELMNEINRAEKLSKKLGIFLNKSMVDMESNKGNNVVAQNTNKKEAIKREIIATSELSKKIIRANCFEPFYTIFIDPKGNIAQCSPAGSGYEDLNLKEKTIKDIWYSEKLNSIRKLIGLGGSLECCSKCGLVDMRENVRRELLEFCGEFNGSNTI